MKQIMKKLSLWDTLLGIAIIIIMYLVTIHTNEALSYSSLATYFNQNQAFISWEPSTGPVENYLLEITETQFLSEADHKNALMSTRQISTVSPFYKIMCKHNHSYQVRVKATSPTGISSSFSETSILFISDKQKPEIRLDPLPSPAKVRSETLLVSGVYEEPHLSSITINGVTASINTVLKTFCCRIKLRRGVNLVTIHAEDLAGNTTTETLDITYAPLTILSFPTGGKIYWNGNYAYPGIFSGVTPQSYNQALEGKSFLRIRAPGFNDYCGIIDFSDLSKDSYSIVLSPFSPLHYTEMTSLSFAGNTAPSSTHAHPFVVDYNLDGIKDLLIGTVEGNIICYTNGKSERTPQFSEHHFLMSEGKDVIDVGTHAAPFMLDYNNDGKSDLLVGNGSGSILYYVNKGSSAEPLFASPEVLEDAYGIPLAVDSHSKPFLVDWDGDKKKDMLVGSGRGTIYYYRNQGTDLFPLFSSPQLLTTGDGLLAVESHASPFVADWDGDGDKDLLVGDGEGYAHLYRNSSSSSGEPHLIKDSMISIDSQELMVDGFLTPFLIDWNQDGGNELFVGSSSGGIYYLNQGK